MLSLKRFLYGLVLTGLTTAACYWVAMRSFENIYYMAQLMPIFLVSYAFMAWMLYIKEDGLLSFNKKGPKVDMLGQNQNEPNDQMHQDSGGKEIADGLKIKDGLVQPRGAPDDEEASADFWHTSKFVLLWSAIQLATLAVILYQFYDIGARF